MFFNSIFNNNKKTRAVNLMNAFLYYLSYNCEMLSVRYLICCTHLLQDVWHMVYALVRVFMWSIWSLQDVWHLCMHIFLHRRYCTWWDILELRRRATWWMMCFMSRCGRDEIPYHTVTMPYRATTIRTVPYCVPYHSMLYCICARFASWIYSVSYTHLTLPTILLV